MNGLVKCMKIPHIVKLRQLAREWRKLASASKVAHAVACKLGSLGFCRVSYVSDDEDLGREKNDGHRLSGSLFAVAPDVPSGYLPVYAGQQCSRRFVIRVAYLNHPVFRTLLEQAEEEFGYAHRGVLSIPCNEFLFELILKLFSQNDQGPSVGHLDLEEVKVNLCNEWYCLLEAKGILLANETEAFPAYAVAEECVG